MSSALPTQLDNAGTLCSTATLRLFRSNYYSLSLMEEIIKVLIDIIARTTICTLNIEAF